MTKTKMRKAQARIFHYHPNQSNIKRPHTFLLFFHTLNILTLTRDGESKSGTESEGSQHAGKDFEMIDKEEDD